MFTVGRKGCDLSIRDQTMPSTLCELKQSEVMTSDFSISNSSQSLLLTQSLAEWWSISCIPGDNREWSYCSGQWQVLPEKYLCSSTGWG